MADSPWRSTTPRDLQLAGYPHLLPCDFGPYRLESRLGEGGMGAVYLGVELESLSHGVRAETAIKIPDAKLLRADPTMAQQFVREARAASQVRHPAVVRLEKVGTVGDIPYIAMELLRGEGLENVVERGPMPPDEVLQVGIEVCGALTAIHDAGLIHRDLKPSNIFRTEHGQVKLLDLGIARAMDASTRLTGTGMSKGTPGYMAPEQLDDGVQLDARTDLFALGATLAELALGEPVFVGKSLMSLLMLMAKAEEHVASGSIGPRVNVLRPGLGDVITSCLVNSPADRPESAAVVRAELEKLLPAAPIRFAPPPSVPPPAPPIAPAAEVAAPAPVVSNREIEANPEPAPPTSTREVATAPKTAQGTREVATVPKTAPATREVATAPEPAPVAPDSAPPQAAVPEAAAPERTRPSTVSIPVSPPVSADIAPQVEAIDRDDASPGKRGLVLGMVGLVGVGLVAVVSIAGMTGLVMALGGAEVDVEAPADAPEPLADGVAAVPEEDAGPETDAPEPVPVIAGEDEEEAPGAEPEGGVVDAGVDTDIEVPEDEVAAVDEDEDFVEPSGAAPAGLGRVCVYRALSDSTKGKVKMSGKGIVTTKLGPGGQECLSLYTRGSTLIAHHAASIALGPKDKLVLPANPAEDNFYVLASLTSSVQTRTVPNTVMRWDPVAKKMKSTTQGTKEKDVTVYGVHLSLSDKSSFDARR